MSKIYRFGSMLFGVFSSMNVSVLKVTYVLDDFSVVDWLGNC